MEFVVVTRKHLVRDYGPPIVFRAKVQAFEWFFKNFFLIVQRQECRHVTRTCARLSLSYTHTRVCKNARCSWTPYPFVSAVHTMYLKPVRTTAKNNPKKI